MKIGNLRNRRKITECADYSPIYKSIKNYKHNGRILNNGDTQVGKNLAMSKKDSILYKI